MSEIPILIQSFKGINLREPAGMIQDDELALCENFNIGRAGELTKRTGFAGTNDGETFGPVDVNLLGHFQTAEKSQLLAVSSTHKLYKSDNGSDWTQITDIEGDIPVTYGVQYVNKFYMSSPDGIYSWDGETLELIEDTPEGTFCLVYKDRLFVLSNLSEHPSRLYFSGVADFEDWPSTNFFDVSPGDGDFLVSCAIIQDLLIIFKTSTTWALYLQGSPQNWVVRNINPEIGCTSKYTPREIEGFLFFVGSRGVYKTDGNIFENISESIEPLFTARIVNQTTVDVDTASWWDDRYIVLLHPTSSTFKYMVFHLRTEGWTEWVFADGIRPTTFVEVISATPGKGLYAGSKNLNGRVYRHGQDTFRDAGKTYGCKFITKDYDFALPSMMKRGKWIGIDALVENADAYIKHYVDGEYLEPLLLEGKDKRRLFKLGGPGYFRYWNFQFESSSSQDLIFYSSTLWMHRKRSTIKAAT